MKAFYVIARELRTFTFFIGLKTNFFRGLKTNFKSFAVL